MTVNIKIEYTDVLPDCHNKIQFHTFAVHVLLSKEIYV